VGKDRRAVEAYIDRFLAARRMPDRLRRDLRLGVVTALGQQGLWAKDGVVRFNPGTGRLDFEQGQAGRRLG
jgi:hypothetical protein